MVLSLRPRQRHAVVELINLMKNSKTTPAAFANDPDAEADEANTYKVLVLDKFTHDIIAPLVTLKDLRDHVIYLDVKDRMAHALLVANLCDLEHRLSLGTNDKMQLAGMVGLFQTARPTLKSA